jgi:polyhydroxyalkanoate synthase
LWTNDDLPPAPREWRTGATERAETWWNDWIDWLATRSGPRVAARGIGSDAHPAGVAAPGGYVFG